MGTRKKRKIDIVVLSDIHLGTYGSHAEELLKYLKTINPKKIILNGDIIDIWQFSKNYWPNAHMQVIKYLTGCMVKGTKVFYLTGNHDEMLRKFAGFKLGSLKIDNKLSLRLGGKKVWIFHGDVFDVAMTHAKWLAKLGAIGYDILILMNAFVNWWLIRFKHEKISLSKRVKDSVKSAVKFINNFEQTVAEIAVENEFDFVICGHIHQPEIKQIETKKGSVMYLNSGDWVENLTALEYDGREWSIYRYNEDTRAKAIKLKKNLRSRRNNNDEIFKDLVNDFLTSK